MLEQPWNRAESPCIVGVWVPAIVRLAERITEGREDEVADKVLSNGSTGQPVAM